MPTDAQIEALIKTRNQRYGKAFADLSVDDVLSFQSKTTVFNDVGKYSPSTFTFNREHIYAQDGRLELRLLWRAT
jgi:hypothetical protein